MKLKFLWEVGRAAAEGEDIKKSKSGLNYMSSKDAEVLFFIHSKSTISRILVSEKTPQEDPGRKT